MANQEGAREEKHSRIGAAGVAGGLAMAFAQFLTQPGDVLKTIVVQDGKGYLKATQKVVAESGYLGMWRGSVPTLLRSTFGGVSFFPSLELMKLITGPINERFDNVAVKSSINFIQGLGGRALTEVVTCPLFIVKTEMEYSQVSGQKKSTWQGLVDLHARSGVRGMFSGVVPSIYRGAFFTGAYVALIDIHKQILRPFGFNPVLETTMAAFGSATIGTMLTHPFDVIRTHIQLDTTRRISMMRATINIWNARGLRLVKRQISYSMMWPTYETLMRLMGVPPEDIKQKKDKDRHSL